MPAIGSRAALAHTRVLRLVGLAISLVFLLSATAVWAAPAEARDWTPQIKTTRRAQIYWEDLMRAADAELRELKKTKKQTQRKLKKIEANLKKAVKRRALTKQHLQDVKAELRAARRPPAPPTTSPLPPPEAGLALQVLVEPPHLASVPTFVVSSTIPAVPALEPFQAELVEPQLSEPAMLDTRTVKKLERSVKKAKRSYKLAARKAKRSQRNRRVVKNKMLSFKAAERRAKVRRTSAEKSLGAWILAMAKYGRIRAVKKSAARPGVTTRFAWPVTGRLSQRYHAGHDGLDIVRYKGAPIRAMAFGVVTYVGWNPWDQHGRAFMVVVAHAGGHETLYGHLLPKRIVRVGEEVKKGKIIGFMGSTGNSTGPHLHLELRRGRTTLNPLAFL